MRILIAEDQKMVQESIKTFLHDFPEIEIVGFADNGQIAIKKTEELNPDIILVDLFMPIMDGLTTTEIISQCFKNTKILILTGQEPGEERYLIKALVAGARGYLLKKNLSDNLIDALQTIHRGSLYLTPVIKELSNYQSEPQTFKLTFLDYWLAREILSQWRKQPIEESISIAALIKDLGIERDRHKNKIIAFLEKTSKHTTLTENLLAKIEDLQKRQNKNSQSYSKLELQRAVNSLENWFRYTNNANNSTFLKELQTNVKFLRAVSLTKISDRLTKLWQKAGTEPLLNFLQELENYLQNTAKEYEQIERDYLYKSNSAWRAYNKLASKLDLEENKQKNWEAAWNALRLTYQFKIEAKVYYFTTQLIVQLADKIQIYYQTLLDTNNLLVNLQDWFAKQASLEPALLPSLLVHLANEVDFCALRNQFEQQTGHFLNQWGAATSISEELLKEKIITFVKPISIQLYLNSCRQALSFSGLETDEPNS